MYFYLNKKGIYRERFFLFIKILSILNKCLKINLTLFSLCCASTESIFGKMVFILLKLKKKTEYIAIVQDSMLAYLAFYECFSTSVLSVRIFPFGWEMWKKSINLSSGRGVITCIFVCVSILSDHTNCVHLCFQVYKYGYLR